MTAEVAAMMFSRLRKEGRVSDDRALIYM